MQTGGMQFASEKHKLVVTHGDLMEPLGLAAAVERESGQSLAEAGVRYADERGGESAATGHRRRTTSRHRHRRSIDRENIQLGDLTARRDEIAAGGRTAVLAAADGTVEAVIGIADALRETSAQRFATSTTSASTW